MDDLIDIVAVWVGKAIFSAQPNTNLRKIRDQLMNLAKDIEAVIEHKQD